MRLLLIGSVGLFGLLQLLPGPRPTNAQVDAAHTLRANVNLTPQVSALLERACENCHSQTTKWPWYSRVAPISWQVVKDVDNARKAMDFSEWSTHLGRRPQIAASALLACCSDLERKRMPSRIYLLLHPEARLNDEDRKVICEWSKSEAAILSFRHGQGGQGK